jgi:hypothetical protein
MSKLQNRGPKIGSNTHSRPGQTYIEINLREKTITKKAAGVGH